MFKEFTEVSPVALLFVLDEQDRKNSDNKTFLLIFLLGKCE